MGRRNGYSFLSKNAMLEAGMSQMGGASLQVFI